MREEQEKRRKRDRGKKGKTNDIRSNPVELGIAETIIPDLFSKLRILAENIMPE